MAGASRTEAVGCADRLLDRGLFDQTPCEVELSDSAADDSRTAHAVETLTGLGFKAGTRIDHEGAPDAYPHVYDVLFTRD